MSAQFYLKAARQRIKAPRCFVRDGPTWDGCEAVYLCAGDSTPSGESLGGFRWGDAFPGVTGFFISDIETEPVCTGLYRVNLTGNGVVKKRMYERAIPTATAHSSQDVLVHGTPGPGTGGKWPNVEVILPGIGIEWTYVGASEADTLHSAKVGQAVQAPLAVAGFPAAIFPQAPKNPYTSLPAELAKLLVPNGWVLMRCDPVPLRAGVAAGPQLLTLGYQHRWKIAAV